jgi:hypothetical protein
LGKKEEKRRSIFTLKWPSVCFVLQFSIIDFVKLILIKNDLYLNIFTQKRFMFE